MARKILAPVMVLLALVFACLGAFALSATAANAAAPDDGSLLDLARPVFDAVASGRYVMGAALALVLIVAGVKRYAPGKAKAFVQSDVGGVVTTLLISFGGALATATSGGEPWKWGLMYSSLTVALVAAGGYTMIKKLLVAPLMASQWYRTKAPAWFRAAFGIVSWIFDKPDATAAAEAKGLAAVKAKPSTGAAGITGSARDVE